MLYNEKNSSSAIGETIDYYPCIDENKRLLKIIEEKNQDIGEILTKLEIQNKDISSMKNKNIKLQEYINTLQKSIEDIREKLCVLNNERILEEQNYYEMINKYEKKIKELVEENETLFLNTNFRISSLLKLIDKKDTIIKNFMK